MEHIPLEVYERVFFTDEIGSDDEHQDDSADVNDFTVTRHEFPPRPPPPPIPKYPEFRAKVVRNHIPSAFYATKIPPPEIEEYQPPPKVKPRDINPDAFQADSFSRDLYNKSLFEKDLLIIDRKRQIAKSVSPQPDPNDIPFKPGAPIPSAFQQSLDANQKRIDEIKDLRRQIKDHNKEQSQRAYRRMQARERQIEKLRIHAAQVAEEDQYRHYQQMHSEAIKEQAVHDQYTRNEAKIARYGPRPHKQTRASVLKAEKCRLDLNRREAAHARERTNDEIRKEKQRQYTERLASTIVKLKVQDDDNSNRFQEEKTKWLQKQADYKKRLKVYENSQLLNKTMLEREYEREDAAERKKQTAVQ